MLVSALVRLRPSRPSPLLALALVVPLGLAAAVPGSAATRRSRKPARAALPQVILPASASAWDLAVGEAARNGLGRAQGAVVAMDPRTGRVHAVVNPALGLQRAFQPCSVFKIVVGIAGLSEGLITPDTTYRCHKGCWSWAGHGTIDLRRALAVSCNPYFEWVGEQLGYETVQRYAHLLGLGEPSGINLTGEAAGVVPAFVRPQAVGHLSSHAKGISTSAVQLAVLVSATLNGGVILKPQVSGPRTSSPRAVAPPGDDAFRRARRGLRRRRQRGQRERRVRSRRRGGGEDRHVRPARVVRVLRAGRPPGARGRRLPQARQRPRRLRRGRTHLPPAVRRRLGRDRRRHALATSRGAAGCERRDSLPRSERRVRRSTMRRALATAVGRVGTTSTSRSTVR